MSEAKSLRWGRPRVGTLRGAVLMAAPCLALGACSDIGLGSGTVTGMVTVPQCTFDANNGGAPIPYKYGAPFDFKPTYFVGEPIDADPINGPRFPANQMIIRVQPQAQRKEDADILILWVFDSAAVARCIRGATVGGVPEWDPVVCDRSLAGPGEPGRMLVGMTSEKVSSFLALNHSCPLGFVSANALGACTDGSCPPVSLCPGNGSWITFSTFGGVSAGQTTTTPIPAGYRVNEDELIEASSFHLELCDVATVLSTLDHVLPVPQPNIVATLDGNFQFNLVGGD